MVEDKPWGVTPNDDSVRDAVRTLFYAVTTTDGTTSNPLAHFVGVNEAPSHALFVGGRLHVVQVGWSKDEVEPLLWDSVRDIVREPEGVISPPFALKELAAIRQAWDVAERKCDETSVLKRMVPTLAAEVRRIAGTMVWADWAYDYVQTELRKGLAASLTALGPNPEPMSAFEMDRAAASARAIKKPL